MTARAPTIFPLAEFAPPVNGTVVLVEVDSTVAEDEVDAVG